MDKKRFSIILLLLLVAVIGVFTFTACSKKTLTLTVEPYEGTYDGTAKSVVVSVSTGDTEGWEITYANDKGEAVDAPVNAGTYEATVTFSKKGYQTATETATVRIAKAATTVNLWPEVVPNYPAEDPQILRLRIGEALDGSMLSFTNVTQEDCPTVASVPGTFSWISGQTSTKTLTYDVVFTPTDSTNYSTLKLSKALGSDKKLPVTFIQATPVLYGASEAEQTNSKPKVSSATGVFRSGMALKELTLSKDFKYVAGESTSEVKVEGSVTWKNPDESLSVSKKYYAYVFKPKDEDNYEVVEGEVFIEEIEKGFVRIEEGEIPETTAIKLGDPIIKSEIIGDRATNSTYGKYEWNDGYSIVADRVGKYTFEATYTALIRGTSGDVEDPEFLPKVIELVVEVLPADVRFFVTTGKGANAAERVVGSVEYGAGLEGNDPDAWIYYDKWDPTSRPAAETCFDETGKWDAEKAAAYYKPETIDATHYTIQWKYTEQEVNTFDTLGNDVYKCPVIFAFNEDTDYVRYVLPEDPDGVESVGIYASVKVVK